MIRTDFRLAADSIGNDRLTEHVNSQLKGMMDEAVAKFPAYYQISIENGALEFAESIMDLFPPAFPKEKMTDIFQMLHEDISSSEYVELSIIMKYVLWHLLQEKTNELLFKQKNTFIPLPDREYYWDKYLNRGPEDVRAFANLKWKEGILRSYEDWRNFSNMFFQNTHFLELGKLSADEVIDWEYKGLIYIRCNDCYQEEDNLRAFLEHCHG